MEKSLNVHFSCDKLAVGQHCLIFILLSSNDLQGAYLYFGDGCLYLKEFTESLLILWHLFFCNVRNLQSTS